MEEFSIDQKKLPGVKEVCRDFAVLEDHCLAHNLQEQEIENHLASNIHKSRLVQQDLRVAKRLQEEEDERAKAQSRRQHIDIERTDNEIAQEIQKQLVRQAELQRQQEEKDEAIARKLQEREMKEERRRQKQLEANFEEQHYEDKGAYQHSSDSRIRHSDSESPVSSMDRHQEQEQDPTRLDKYAEYHPVETSRSKASEHYNTEGTRGRNDGKGRRPEHYSSEGRNKYPEEHLSERNRHSDAKYPENRKGKKYQTQDQWDESSFDQESTVSKKERVYVDDQADQDRAGEKERDRARRKDKERERERDGRRNRDKLQYRAQDGGPDKPVSVATSRDQRRRPEAELDLERQDYRHQSKDGDLDWERDRRGHKDAKEKRNRDKYRSRDGSRGQEQDYQSFPSAHSRSDERPEDADYGSRLRATSVSNEVFEEPSSRGHSGEPRSPGHPSRERGRNVRGEYGVKEATQGLAQMDFREQEYKDMEVARKLQEEELKARHLDKRAAQVAQDEEIARRLMEEEKRELKRTREKEKQAMERQQRERRPEGDLKPTQEDIVRPRTREEYDYQRARNNPKPVRPPPPRTHNYENVDSSYVYSENYSPRPPSRPDIAYKGAYYRQ